jgi:hypothetical protein
MHTIFQSKILKVRDNLGHLPKMGVYYCKKLWKELIAYFLIQHRQHKKQRIQHFFCCCVCIYCHGNVFTEPLPSNDMGIRIQTHRLMGGIYEYAVG